MNRKQMNEVFNYKKELESIERCERIVQNPEIYLQKKDKLNKAIEKCEKEIAMLPNSKLRALFRMRYIECMTWQEIADQLGGKNTVDSVKKMVYRQFALHEEREERK